MVCSRNKGNRGEREARELFWRWFPDTARSYGQARKQFSQPDLIGEVQKYFFIEVKFGGHKCLLPFKLKGYWKKLIDDYDMYIDVNQPNQSAEPILVYHNTDSQTKDWFVMRNNGKITITWREFQDELDEMFPIITNKQKEKK